MKELLFLSQRIPYPPTKGEKIRHLQILRHLCTRYRVHLGCFIDDPHDWQFTDAVRDLCGETYFAPLNPLKAKLGALRAFATGEPISAPYFYSRDLARWVDDLLVRRRPSVAFACSSVMGQFLIDAPHRPDRMVMDFCDVDSDKWRQYAERRKGVMRWVYARESRTLLRFDRKIGAAFDASLFATSGEAALFGRLAPELRSRVHAVHNGVDAVYFSPDHGFDNPYSAPSLAFTGTMNYWPNVDAVTWFAEQVFPLIRQHLPTLQFTIVGANPAPEVSALAERAGIVVTGRVPDVRPYLAHAALVVAPLRVGNGVQNKVLEAMAMARPVVATPRALAGVDLDRERDVIVAESETAFADAVLRALGRDDLGALGSRARNRILGAYDWRVNMAALDPMLGDDDAAREPRPDIKATGTDGFGAGR